jgi:uncharacterized protein (UPF0332 family)
VTPGQAEEADAELRRAEEALRAARLLLGADAPESAASRLYYAVFHATRAALLVRGRSSKTHSGQITLFTETFGEAPVLGSLLRLRAQADYELGDFSASRVTIERHAADAEAFVERCGQIVAEAVSRGPDEPDPPADY